MKKSVSKSEESELRRLTAKIAELLKAAKASIAAGDEWTRRRKRREELRVEVDSSRPDPCNRESLAAWQQQRTELDALEKLLLDDPRTGPQADPEVLRELCESVLELARRTFAAADPFIELDYKTVCGAGLYGVEEANYTAERGLQRLLNYSINFAFDGSEVALRLAKHVLSRRLPEVGRGFGMTPRPLTPQERSWLDKNAVMLEEAA